MASGSEKKALQIIHEAGGEASSHIVSRKLGIDTGYARLLCMNLARKDYVDLKRSGRFMVTFKGKQSLMGKSRVGEEKTSPRVPNLKDYIEERGRGGGSCRIRETATKLPGLSISPGRKN